MNTNDLYKDFKGGPDLGPPSFSDNEIVNNLKLHDYSNILGFTKENTDVRFKIGNSIMCCIKAVKDITMGRYYEVIGYDLYHKSCVFIIDDRNIICSYNCGFFDYIF